MQRDDDVTCILTLYRVNQKTFVIMFMLYQNKFVFINCIFTFLMALVMVAINKTMGYLFHLQKLFTTAQ